jgi:hypothetical protein
MATKKKTYKTDANGLPKVFKTILTVDVPLEIVTFKKFVALQLYRAIIKRSPVDRGFYRASHNVSVDARLLTTPKVPVKKKQGSHVSGRELAEFYKGLSSLSELKPDQDIWITSNLPYSRVIEYGGYPTNPVQGSYVRRGRPGAPGYFILSQGGFSRQAPMGVYRISAKEVVTKLKAGGLLK